MVIPLQVLSTTFAGQHRAIAGRALHDRNVPVMHQHTQEKGQPLYKYTCSPLTISCCAMCALHLQHRGTSLSAWKWRACARCTHEVPLSSGASAAQFQRVKRQVLTDITERNNARHPTCREGPCKWHQLQIRGVTPLCCTTSLQQQLLSHLGQLHFAAQG